MMVLMATVGVLVLTGCVSAPPTNPGQPSAGGTESTAEPSATMAAGECDYIANDNAAKPVDLPAMSGVPHTGTAEVTLETEAGPLVITLDRELVPCTVNSFVSLSEQGFYDETECHRMADSGIFILQCGDPTGTGTGGPGYSFADEGSSDMAYPAGTVAMANSGPDTNGSQFFFLFRDTPFPPDYTVFGHLDEDSLARLVTLVQRGHDGSHPDGSGRPNPPIVIEKATLTSESDEAPSSSPTADSSGR